jgi:uncharacterized protein with HEPN domain
VTPAAADAGKYLWDAQRAAERIARFTRGRSFDDYQADEMLRAAVERQFEIIGEALAGLRRSDAAIAARIPDSARIIAFRIVLIHGYASVDDRLVWGVVERDLAALLTVLGTLLAETRP